MRLPFLCLFLAFLLSGCQALTDQLGFPQATPTAAFIPPAVAATLPAPEPSPTLTPEAARPTPLPPCTDGLAYREDLSIPDGTLVAPAEALDKRWRVENTGTCNWDQAYQVRLVAGPELGASLQQAIYPARSGTQATIRMLFTAPNEPGTYRSAWQAYNPAGEAFGDPFFIEIVVGSPKD